MRAARLHGPDDVRVEDVPEPVGEVVVTVRAATTCGTDLKMLRHGHPTLAAYPAPFGHETAGERIDTGERVLVGDSVPCGTCPPCRAGRTHLCRAMTWVYGGFAERIAAPAAALHSIPGALPFSAAAMAEPLAACVHAVGRGTSERAVAVLGGGTIGLMLARLLVLDGRDVAVIDRHPERRAQADDLGARGVDALEPGAVALVFEAVGRPEAWHAALLLVAPGGRVVMVGGCPGGDVALPAVRIHYDEVDVVGAFHHRPAEIDEALLLLSTGAVDHAAFAGPTVGLDDLAAALVDPPFGAEARKLVVDPTR
ncbi:Sorbitol dehydrogenase [Baekduia alba]|uniref:zinc-dependent alcohol dehydrogenase n=1 Tax=Baekduia alba TaxID=2997333 RepID=UPI00233F8DC4|nr:alcohol dehydrogenase catalytic domain-containing protein [Baekduia alba]WCB95972.1 Sorbitol dehydrogenase [Baekduia alba]